MNKVFQTSVLILVVSVLSGQVYASEQTTMVPMVGEYAEIDTKSDIKVIEALQMGGDVADVAIKNIKEHPAKFAPIIFYQAAFYLFDQGKRNEAIVWLLRGQLRSRFDANRCADLTARAAVAVMNSKISPEMKTYMRDNIDELVKVVQEVVEWDRTTPYEYDERWINLHGMDAMQAGLKGETDKEIVFSLPKEQWPEIAEKTRQDYLQGFQEAQKMMKNQQQK